MRVSDERGSVLALVPAGFLVLVVLAAIAVDGAVGLLGQRQCADLAAAIANDVAGAGVSSSAFYRGGAVVVDPVAAERTACAVVSATGSGGVQQVRVALAVDGPSVTVSVSGVVAPVFGRRLPGAERRVGAEATASASTGARLTSVGSAALSPVACSHTFP